MKALKKTSWLSKSGLNPTRTTPPCYNNATLDNRLCSQHKGPNVTNPICWTCKNCSSVLLTANIVTQSSTDSQFQVLIIFPLKLQTITTVDITYCLPDGYWDCRPAGPEEGHPVSVDTCRLISGGHSSSIVQARPMSAL